LTVNILNTTKNRVSSRNSEIKDNQMKITEHKLNGINKEISFSWAKYITRTHMRGIWWSL